MLAVVLVIAVFAAAFAAEATVQRRLVERMSRLNEGYVTLVRGLDDVRRDVSTLERIADLPEPRALRQSLAASTDLVPVAARVDAELVTLLDLIASLGASSEHSEERDFLKNFEAMVVDIRVENERVGELVREVVEALTLDLDAGSQPRRELRLRLGALDKRLEDATELVEALAEAALTDLRDAQASMARRIAAGIVLVAIFALLAIGFIARALNPIADLTAAAARLGEGDHTRVRGADDRTEVGLLAREFNAMADAIRDRDARLRRQRDEIERAYAELVVAQRARAESERLAAVGDLGGRITHELRNPLSTIGLNAEMLRQELEAAGANDDVREMLAAIGREVARLGALTDEYLGMARNAASATTIDADVVIADVLRLFGPEFERDGVEVETVLNPCPLAFTEGSLRQLVINLLRNAQAAVGDSAVRRIGVVTDADVDGATVRVLDSGPGLTDRVQAHLFEPFFTTRPDGTGLGLAICRQIARAHGADLEVIARSDLGGAEFVLRVPRPPEGRGVR